MKASGVKYRKGLSQGQVRVLNIVFKFRFVSCELLAKYLEKDRSTIYERLSVLVKQGYVDKQYGGSYKLAGKPAIYSLATKGIRALLKSEGNLSRSGLRNMYRNSSLTPEYIQHCLDVFAVFIALKRQYGPKFNIYSKNELSGEETFPTTKPDLYLQGKGTADRPHYMLDIFDTATDFMTRRKRLKALFAHEDSGDWDEEYGNYPCYLFVVAEEKVIPRLVKEVEYYYNRSYVDEEEITTHITSLGKLTCEEDPKVWQLYESDPDDEGPVMQALQ